MCLTDPKSQFSNNKRPFSKDLWRVSLTSHDSGSTQLSTTTGNKADEACYVVVQHNVVTFQKNKTNSGSFMSLMSFIMTIHKHTNGNSLYLITQLMKKWNTYWQVHCAPETEHPHYLISIVKRIQSQSSTLSPNGKDFLDRVECHRGRLIGEAMAHSLRIKSEKKKVFKNINNII